MLIPHINFVGCGRLGKTIGHLFKIKNVAIIDGVICSCIENAEAAVKFIGEGKPYKVISELPKTDIYFITTRDDMIQSICDQLVNDNLSGAIILHCSGLLSSDTLKKASQFGCHIASIHPIKSFATCDESIKSFSGTYCAIEGDDQAVSVITNLFTGIGGIVFQINKDNKRLYHAAGAIANNYLVTLHYHAVQCYKIAGIDEQIAKKIASMLMIDALRNIEALDHHKALTGPIQRGDINTIQNHVAVLSKSVTQDMYAALGLATLPLTNHSHDKKNELIEILMQNSKDK